MILAVVGSKLYDLMLLLHLLAVVIGLGPLTVNGFYTSRALKARGSEGRAVSLANFEVSKLCQWAVYTIPIWGIGLIIGSGKVKKGGKYLYDFGKPWVSAGFLVWIVIVGVYHGLVLASHRKLNAALADGSEDQVKSLEGRMALGGALIDLLLVVAIYLMVFKPGQ